MIKKKLAAAIALALTIMMPTQLVVNATNNNNSSVIEEVENEDEEDAQEDMEDEEKREEVTLKHIEGSKEPETLYVVVGTKNKEVREMLPETIMAEVEDGRVLEFDVEWDISSYKQNQVGSYKATGELTSKEYKITNSKKVLVESIIISKDDKEEVPSEGLSITISPIEEREESLVEIVFRDENIEDEATIVIEDMNGNLVFIDQISSEDESVEFMTVLPKGEYKGFVNALDMYDWDNLGGKVEFEFIVE